MTKKCFIFVNNFLHISFPTIEAVTEQVMKLLVNMDKQAYSKADLYSNANIALCFVFFAVCYMA